MFLKYLLRKIENKILVEIKPTNLQTNDINIAKIRPAKKFCKSNNLIFLVVDEPVICRSYLIELVKSEKIILNKNWNKKIKNGYRL